MPELKSILISFQKVIRDFFRELIKAFKPIKAKIQADIKNSRIIIFGNSVISIRNKTKKRYRNIARARLLMGRWQT